jgi:hypothetical protein
MNSRSPGSTMARRHAIIALAVLGIAALSFGIGESLGQRSMMRSYRIELDAVQARLLVDRIVEERRIKALLGRGCATQAMGEITNNENADLKTLTEFVERKLDQSTLAYISNQDPDILSELKTFKGTYVNTWSASGCQR